LQTPGVMLEKDTCLLKPDCTLAAAAQSQRHTLPVSARGQLSGLGRRRGRRRVRRKAAGFHKFIFNLKLGPGGFLGFFSDHILGLVSRQMMHAPPSAIILLSALLRIQRLVHSLIACTRTTEFVQTAFWELWDLREGSSPSPPMSSETSWCDLQTKSKSQATLDVLSEASERFNAAPQSAILSPALP
jgi:hypothetical protein